MPKDMKKIFAAAERGDFETAEKAIRAHTSSFDWRPQLRYFAALRAADAGLTKEAAAYKKTLTTSAGDQAIAHLGIAHMYAEESDGLSLDLDAIANHFREAEKRIGTPELFNQSSGRLMVRSAYAKVKSPEVRARFEAAFSNPKKWTLVAPAPKPEVKMHKPVSKPQRRKVVARFKQHFGKTTSLALTAAMKKRMSAAGFSLTDQAMETGFFDYAALDDDLVSALWQYGLANSKLEPQVEAGALVPFAALDTDGATFAFSDVGLAEENNCGILCLDAANAEGDDCPVIWVYGGKSYPWAAKASSLKIRLA